MQQPITRPPRRGIRCVAVVLGLVTLSVLGSCGHSDENHAVENGPIPPLSSSGRWFTDAAGRVVMFHGFNDVAKSAPFYPAAFGFGDDDAAFLAQEGFNALRLGVDFRGLMPTPGQVDESYIDHLAGTVDVLARHRFFVLIDFHQDGFAPMFNGNGFPDWMAITDGQRNPPDATFPMYYIQNPAMQRAFEHFWANSPGPNGVGLQDYFVQGLTRVVERFADNPWVLGYELMNEPFPGAAWGPCLFNAGGCPELEQQLLMPFYRKAGAVARAIAPTQFVFVEPFVLFNFGGTSTLLPGTGSGNVLSFHSYANTVAGEKGVVAQAVAAAAERDHAPLLATEFGATLDAVMLNRITGEMDGQLVPWIEWAYNELIEDPTQPAGTGNLRSLEAFAALVRPYPMAVTGTPTKIVFDPSTMVFDLTYDTARPGGGQYRNDLVTIVSVPRRRYPHGYTVTAEGASVTSVSCALLLTLRNLPDAETVSVQVTPANAAGVSSCP